MIDDASGDLSARDEPTEEHRYRLEYVPDDTDPDNVAGTILWAVACNDHSPYENWDVRYTDNVLDAKYFTRAAVDALQQREGLYPDGNIRVHETTPDGNTQVVSFDNHPASDADASPSPDDVPPATILAPSPLLTLAAFVAGLAVDWGWPTALLPAPWHLAVGVPLLMAGSALFMGAIWTMDALGKHPSHADEPPGLITAGPYRYSRNPIYVGHSLAHIGGAVLLGSLWALVVLGPVVGYLHHVITQEEARLRALFGDEYDTYQDNTRRWL
jgi:protein-S-isoprenylcysteine O-methyltransferase Ste14